MDDEKLGQKIRTRRKELGITARELAIQAKVVPTYISKLESQNILPSPNIIVRISRALKHDYLMEYIEEKDPELFRALWISFTHAFEESTRKKLVHK